MIKIYDKTKIINSLVKFRIPQEQAPAFSPDSLDNLIGWWDASYGVINTIGNNFTDSNASIESTISANRTLQVGGSYNSKLSYSQSRLTDGVPNIHLVRWNGSAWEYVIDYYDYDYDTGEYPFNNSQTVQTASGNTQYPWQATWSGGAVTRTATTVDTAATVGQLVSKWNGRFGQSATQSTLNSRPTLRQNYIEFNAKSLNIPASDFQSLITAAATNNQYGLSFYFVGNFINTGSVVTGSALYGNSILGFNNTLSIRCLPQTAGIGIRSSNQTSSPLTVVPGLIFSQGGDDIFCVSFSNRRFEEVNLPYQVRKNGGEDVNIQVPFNGGPYTPEILTPSTFNVGSNSANSRQQFKEILVYRQEHTAEQKTQVINYLNSKYNVF